MLKRPAFARSLGVPNTVRERIIFSLEAKRSHSKQTISIGATEITEFHILRNVKLIEASKRSRPRCGPPAAGLPRRERRASFEKTLRCATTRQQCATHLARGSCLRHSPLCLPTLASPCPELQLQECMVSYQWARGAAQKGRPARSQAARTPKSTVANGLIFRRYSCKLIPSSTRTTATATSGRANERLVSCQHSNRMAESVCGRIPPRSASDSKRPTI
jgi:hypothetical protein